MMFKWAIVICKVHLQHGELGGSMMVKACPTCSRWGKGTCYYLFWFSAVICFSLLVLSSFPLLYIALKSLFSHSMEEVRWSGGAKVSCILRHLGVQLILAYSWARPAILVAGKGRWGIFLFLLFLHFHSCSSFFPVPLFHLFYYLFYHLSPFFWETTQNDPQGLTCR